LNSRQLLAWIGVLSRLLDRLGIKSRAQQPQRLADVIRVA
jgi:hypothetical protein